MQLSVRETGASVILAFRGAGAEAHTTIKPVSLAPGVPYQVSTSRGRAVAEIDGAALMEDGVEMGWWPGTAGHIVILTPTSR